MDTTLTSVEQFHIAFGLNVAGGPYLPKTESDAAKDMDLIVRQMERMGEELKRLAARHGGLLFLRLQLCQEELAELGRAMADDDIVEVLDALCDMRYVADGTAISLGLHGVFINAFSEVHNSNMSKLGRDGRPIISPAGRVEKGPDYFTPRLERFLP